PGRGPLPCPRGGAGPTPAPAPAAPPRREARVPARGRPPLAAPAACRRGAARVLPACVRRSRRARPSHDLVIATKPALAGGSKLDARHLLDHVLAQGARWGQVANDLASFDQGLQHRLGGAALAVDGGGLRGGEAPL